MKKYPYLYKNTDSVPKSHNQSLFPIKETKKENDIKEKLDGILHRLKDPYNKKVIIKTEKKIYITYIIARQKDNIITLEEDYIPIRDIVSIEEIA